MHNNCLDECENKPYSYNQKPNEKMDYKWDYKPALNPDGDSIVSSSWVVPTELLGSNSSFTNFETTIFIKVAGENPYAMLGNVYKISNLVVTSQGRELEQDFYLKIQESENSC